MPGRQNELSEEASSACERRGGVRALILPQRREPREVRKAKPH